MILVCGLSMAVTKRCCRCAGGRNAPDFEQDAVPQTESIPIRDLTVPGSPGFSAMFVEDNYFAAFLSFINLDKYLAVSSPIT